MISPLQNQIEQDLARREPDVEVLLAEIVGADTLRVFIDHPTGVTLELCERVTMELSGWRERYALEVSSPGQDRPLTKPAHFRRFVGQRARVRVRAAGHSPARRRAGVPAAAEHLPLPRSVTGELLGASDDEVMLAAPDGVVAIRYSDIQRSNLVGS